MCGINGIFSYKASAAAVDADELIATRDQMRARGPDGSGHWLSADGRVGLAHRRLSIIDLSEAANQPMVTADRRHYIVFNGEIYNYRELRAGLLAQGVTFATHSDTEVILHLYRRYGEHAVDHLRGMFAFAIWDAAPRILVLARDRYGIKPLYYSDDGGQFRFASQVKALQVSAAPGREPDPGGTVGFLLWGSVPEPLTICKGIRAVPAGAVLKVSASGPGEPRRYWSVAAAIRKSCERAPEIPHGAELEYVRGALRDSVRHHMVADVPVGAFLSAGLDSATVVALAKEQSGAALRTITLAFAEFKGSAADELPIAAEIAAHLGVRHEAHAVGIGEFDAEIARFLAAMDQPTVDGLNTWFVSKAAAAAGLKVALSGLGGDELFGGYWTFGAVPECVRRYARWRAAPLLGRAFRALYAALFAGAARRDPRTAGLLEYGGSYHGAYQLQRGLFMPWELHRIVDADFARRGMAELGAEREAGAAADPDAALNAFGRLVELESTRYMRNQLLRDTDWVGMAHSLEIRVPLVDHVLTEQVVGLAAGGRLGKGKEILPKSVAAGLPAGALRRPKTGFTIPLWRWLAASREADAWRRCALLRRANNRPVRRWAYTLLARSPETAGILRP